MSNAKRIYSDGFYIDYTPSSDIVAGDVVVESTLVMIADADFKAGELGALSIHGVYDVTKEAGAGVTFALGDVVDWDATNKVAVASGNGVKMGICTSNAGDDDSKVRVKLIG